jgi:sulfoxide reductase heme-binding subunit YedZ
MSDAALWYLGRSTGVVCFVLLSLVVVLGIVTRSGRPLPGLPRFAVAAVHRSASLLAVVLVVVHIATLTLDPQAQIGWVDAVLPFGSDYRPVYVGLGALAFDLLGAVIITSLLRQRIGRRVWRAVHWSAYALWPAALLHTVGSGSDLHQRWLLTILVGCAVAMLGALAWRCSDSFLDETGRLPGTLLPRSANGETIPFRSLR